MTAFEVYKNYLALKSHFTRDSYNYFKYNGKVNATIKSFEGRRDRFYFEKLSKLRDPTSYILSNIIEDPNVWVGELCTSDKSEAIYKGWLKRTQSLSYTFSDEISELQEDFNSNFLARNGEHPYVIRLFLRSKISLETLIILCHIVKCFGHWDKHLEYDPVWRDIKRKMIKYQPFMKYDLEKFKKIVMEKFSGQDSN